MHEANAIRNHFAGAVILGIIDGDKSCALNNYLKQNTLCGPIWLIVTLWHGARPRTAQHPQKMLISALEDTFKLMRPAGDNVTALIN